VRLSPATGWFGAFQSLEFASLIAAAAGSAGAKVPLLANGANLAFEKEAFMQVGGFSGNSNFPSGDDIFLLQSVKKQFGASSVKFIKSKAALVTTPPQESLKGFLNQRLRWVSKNKGYRDGWVLFSGALVYLANALFPLLLFAGFFNLWAWKAALIWFAVKIIVDLPVLAGVSSFTGTGKTIWLIPVVEIWNSLYTTFIGIAGSILSFEWKGRKY